MGFGPLRVINEDYIYPDSGFPTHPHNDMEIITYILSGQLAHKDSTGNKAVLNRGDVQRMSAGSGLTHSEYNPSSTEKVHLFQTWILPDKKGYNPQYEDKHIPEEKKKDNLHLIASQSGKDGSFTIYQDAELYASILSKEKSLDYSIESGRGIWLQLASGILDVDGHRLEQGDAVAITNEAKIQITSLAENSEFIMFDLKIKHY